MTVDGRTLTDRDNYNIKVTARVQIDGKPFLREEEQSFQSASPPFDSHARSSRDESSGFASPLISSSTLHVPAHLPTPKLWLYHKPAGVIVSHKDSRFGRETVFEKIQRDYFNHQHDEFTGNDIHSSSIRPPSSSSSMPRFISVGRLDYLSEGLLLLTNAGSIQQFLEHPSADLKRTYHIRIRGALTHAQMRQLEDGLNMDGFQFRPVEIRLLRSSRDGDVNWYEVVVTEGKNRELRTLLNYFDLNIEKLVRVGFHEWRLQPHSHSQPRSTDGGGGGGAIRVFTQSSPNGYDLAPGELIQVPWSEKMEKRRLEWEAQFKREQRAPTQSSHRQQVQEAVDEEDSLADSSSRELMNSIPQPSISRRPSPPSSSFYRNHSVSRSVASSSPLPSSASSVSSSSSYKSRWLHSTTLFRSYQHGARSFSTSANSSHTPDSASSDVASIADSSSASAPSPSSIPFKSIPLPLASLAAAEEAKSSPHQQQKQLKKKLSALVNTT